VTRWLVTGAGGMLGRDLCSMLRRQDCAVTAVTRADLDVTDAAAVAATLRRGRPDVVVNCAAWTNVDLAETHEAEAAAVNGAAASHLAAGCAQIGAAMIQLSTDYVFAGRAEQPYPEDAAPAPVSAYGRTKLAGEQAVLEQLPDSGYILRTAWLYGAHGSNFVKTMIRLERQKPTVAVVDDQRGQPTSTTAVAERIIAMVAARAPAGIYHATCSGQTTWFGLAREVFASIGADPDRVTAIPSTELDRPAPRPAYSVLAHGGWARAGLGPIEDWHSALSRAIPLIAAEHPDNPAATVANSPGPAHTPNAEANSV
jgi:dTDP-4-dehydrorhamnose reductase